MSGTTDTLERMPLAEEQPLITGNQTFADVTEKIGGITEQKTHKLWWIALGISSSLLLMMLALIGWLVWEGIGTWGLNVPVGWGWAIVNFVFWVGIGHAGTLISAILFLFRQKWRTSINRFAEAMTLFAVICALIFPGIHVGQDMGGLLDVSGPEPDGHVAKFPQSITLGYFCRGYLFYGFLALLVYRIDSGFGFHERPGKDTVA